MPGQDPPESELDAAASVFAALVIRHEEGEALDLDAACTEHPELAAELHSLYQGWRAVRNELDQVSPRQRPGANAAVTEHWRGLLAHLTAHPGPADRYEPGDQIGRGGFGVVTRVWDRRLKRFLAMKVLHRDETRNVARFLEEAQITAQLDHPGIVPVHDLGIDGNRQLYFTMKRVRGETFDQVLEKVIDGTGGWNETRALGVLLRACEAVAFAHSRNVIHRDLKPANLMVGRYGEAYVMDWGLARIRDVPRETGGPPETAEIRTTGRREDSGSPLLTRDGDILGTVNYMAPEQARGAPASPAADVYSLGAVLYELLARQRPYEKPSTSPGETLHRVLAGPPRSIAELQPKVAPELVAIADKAMARDVTDRYATMDEMAEDLRAYLEGRVVRAHQTGAWVEFQKWVARNRGIAAALASLVVVVAAATAALFQQQKARNSAQAVSLAEIRRQADVLLAPGLIARAAELGPLRPDSIPRMQQWLAEARQLESRARGYLEELEALRREGHVQDEGRGDSPRQREERAMLQEQLERSSLAADEASATLSDPQAGEDEKARARHQLHVVDRANEVRRQRVHLLEHCIEFDRPWALPTRELQERHDALAGFASQLDSLFWAEDSVQRDVQERLREAGELRVRSLDEHQEEWRDAVETIADVDLCPLYGGLEITPQLGLVPLGQDPSTGLWEFWHVLSGERPQRDADGKLIVGDDTGLVLVLVPGGAVQVGAQRKDPSQPNFCRYLNVDLESPVREVVLSPYFLSRYEMTQGQWLRATGQNPSKFRAGNHYRLFGIVDWTHPVEQVSWLQCTQVLARWDLVLPTECQWERAARGTGYRPLNGFGLGGATEEDLAAYANLADQALEKTDYSLPVDPFNDGYPFHSPVDALQPSDFGFCGIAGNVYEWCKDCFGETWAEADFAPGTGEILTFPGEEHTLRGGSFRMGMAQCTATYRYGLRFDASEVDVGLRPARLLDVPPEPAGEGEFRSE